MPAIIESVATAASHRPIWAKGALRLADEAISECLERAQRRPAEVDLLINAGIYREKNLAEPALASMIQEDVGANLGHPPGERSHGTFSFDVGNGGCGVMTALELTCGFIQSSTIELGVVVASDSNPGGIPDFPFPNAGGAVLLRPGPADAGFVAFCFQTFPEFAASFESHVAWHMKPHPLPLLPKGENALSIAIGEDFAERALDCSEQVLRRFVAEQGLRPGDVDLLVASAYPKDFAVALARRIGLAPEHVALPDEAFSGAHTAGIIAALEAAMSSGQLLGARNVLFVTAGAGITVAAALYRHRALV